MCIVIFYLSAGLHDFRRLGPGPGAFRKIFQPSRLQSWHSPGAARDVLPRRPELPGIRNFGRRLRVHIMGITPGASRDPLPALAGRRQTTGKDKPNCRGSCKRQHRNVEKGCYCFSGNKFPADCTSRQANFFAGPGRRATASRSLSRTGGHAAAGSSDSRGGAPAAAIPFRKPEYRPGRQRPPACAFLRIVRPACWLVPWSPQKSRAARPCLDGYSPYRYIEKNQEKRHEACRSIAGTR